MFSTDDVINLVCKTGAALMYEAVLTSPACAFDYETARPHLSHEPLARICRARALATRRICSKSMK